MAETVRIKVIIDPKGAKKGSKQTKEYLLDIGEAAEKTEKQTKELGLGTVTAGNLMAMAYSEVAQRALQVIKQTKELAFTVEETGSKYKTVLGPSIDKTNQFLERNASLMGVTNTEGKEYLSTAVAIAQGLDMQGEAAADFGIEWTKLAADFQSFFNVPFEESFGAIRSGLVGEQEPLKRFGIVLTEAATQERALMMTGKKRAESLTDLEKVQARYNLIVEKSGKAVGDLERTQDSGANVDRRYQAAKRQIAEVLATRTIPMWTAAAETGLTLTDTILEMIQPTNEVSRSYRQLERDVTNLNDNIVPLIDEYDDLTGKTDLTNTEQERLNTIIERLSETVPVSAKVFDEYGNVIGINTDKTRAYVEQMQKIERLRNREEIERITGILEAQTTAVQNTTESIEALKDGRSSLSAAPTGFSARAIQSIEDYDKLLVSLQEEGIPETLQSLLDLGYTVDQIEKEFPDATKTAKEFWDAISGSQVENIDARLNSIISETQANSPGDEETDELKNLKKLLDELLTVQGQWTQAQAQEAIRIDSKIQKIEAERKAREDLLEVMRQGIPQRSSPISGSDRDITGESIGSDVPDGSFSTTNSDSRSIQQLQEERTDLQKQFTETTNSEERKRLLSRLQMNEEYMTAAEQGISREEMLRQQSQQRSIEQFQQYVQTIAQGYNQIVQIQGQATQARIDKINQEKQAALSAIDARLQNQKLTERQREELVAKREKTEEEYQEKVDELKHKQFERERKAKLAEIAMNTAIAISKFWATQGPLAIVTQALAVGMGIAQAAIVAKQPNPYLQGGLVEERMQSGKTSPGKKLISVNENNKPEFIMNAATTARSLPLLNRMNRDPEYAAMINRQMKSRTPVGGRRQSVAGESSYLTNIGPMVSAAVREGLEGARVSSHINWSDFHHGYERWKDNQNFIGN